VSAPAPAGADDRKLSCIERAKMPKATDVRDEIAANHGVCTNLLPMRRTDSRTGETSVIGVPCGTTYASKCPRGWGTRTRPWCSRPTGT
jgi:hypothetical protein